MIHLRATLERRYGGWGVDGLRVVGGGIEFMVCRAASREFGEIALRVPWGPKIPYTTPLDSRRVLRQEELLSRHLRRCGLPAPRIYSSHYGGDGPDFLVSEYVEHDRSSCKSADLGALVRTIHEAPPPDSPCIGDGEGPVREAVARRMVRHLEELNHELNLGLAAPGFEETASGMEWEGERRRLLHMDARPPENVLILRREIVSVIDWTSALTADPALEICRMDELGLIDSEFLSGYADRQCLARVPRRVELAYRLDTAAMLARLFTGMVPDPDRAKRQIERVRQLCGLLRAEWN